MLVLVVVVVVVLVVGCSSDCASVITVTAAASVAAQSLRSWLSSLPVRRRSGPRERGRAASASRQIRVTRDIATGKLILGAWWVVVSHASAAAEPARAVVQPTVASTSVRRVLLLVMGMNASRVRRRWGPQATSSAVRPCRSRQLDGSPTGAVPDLDGRSS